ncbi:hypothetical protein [Pseudooceanicola batsensis]|uniref:hypothetical protein n=1 Tax=Pseudooceanicola batsensis TaxID=314255 RepID=UPI0003226415|nr:hypothetical protein [Pseudooceanicola batsensis]
MTLIQAEPGTSELTGQIEEILDELKRLKSDLRMVQGYVQSEEPGHTREALRCAGDVRSFLKLAYDVEARVNEERRKELGIAGDTGFDLGEARDQIGCKLDRLRGCCGSGPFS